MSRFRSLLKLRRQHDSIKFALIMYVCAACFLTHAIIQIAEYANYLNKPAEYIFEACSGEVSDIIGLGRICQTECVVSASLQRGYIVVSEDDKSLAVSELSAEYLFKCYGIDAARSTERIWLNPTAFDELAGDSQKTSVVLSCSVDGKNKYVEFVKCGALDSEDAFAVSAGTAASLDGSGIVRALLDGIDASGDDIRHIENLGYKALNTEDMLVRSHRQEIVFSDVKYSIITAVISLVCANAFVKIFRLSTKSR